MRKLGHGMKIVARISIWFISIRPFLLFWRDTNGICF